MKMGLRFGFDTPATGGAPPPAPDFSAEVDALLSGTAGWAVDLSDTTTVFTDTAGTTPVANAGVDTIARLNSKFGTTAYNWQNATTPPLWTGSAGDYDGVDDFLQSAAGYAFASSLTQECITFRCRPAALAAAMTPFAISHSTANLTRRTFQLNADGSITIQSRRANGDTPTTIVTATGLVTAGAALTIQTRIDFSADTFDVYLNGSLVGSATHGGASGVASDATNTSRVRFGSSLSGSQFFDGTFGRAVYMRGIPTAGQNTSITGFVEETTI